ncbi:MAG: NifB/NifX family molybdenum-iron cluster-binding protein [Thermoplasmata archaeon]
MRILIPVLEKNGLESRASPHFGRAPFLALVDTDEDGKNMKISFAQGEGPHEEREGKEEEIRAHGVHGSIISLHPDVIIASMMGPRAVSDFAANHIKLVSVRGTTVSDLVSSYFSGNYSELQPHYE